MKKIILPLILAIFVQNAHADVKFSKSELKQLKTVSTKIKRHIKCKMHCIDIKKTNFKYTKYSLFSSFLNSPSATEYNNKIGSALRLKNYKRVSKDIITFSYTGSFAYNIRTGNLYKVINNKYTRY